MNSDPWSYVIYVRLGYLVNHLFSTEFSIYIASFYHIVLFRTILLQVIYIDIVTTELLFNSNTDNEIKLVHL